MDNCYGSVVFQRPRCSLEVRCLLKVSSSTLGAGPIQLERPGRRQPMRRAAQLERVTVNGSLADAMPLLSYSGSLQ